MKNQIKLLSGLVATAALAISAHAQLAANDISVGFTTNASTNSFEVKAGTVSALAADTTQTLIGNFSSQLSAISSTWRTDTSSDGSAALLWGAQGKVSNTNVFASSQWAAGTAGTLGQQSGADWSVASVGTANTKIDAFNTAFGSGLAGTGHTVANTNSGSFSKALALTGNGLAFGTFDSTVFAVAAGDVAASGTYSAVDLFSVKANTDTFLGTFALYTAVDGSHNVGDLTFTAAIPEPSTYAAILGVATLGFAALRRRKQALVA